MLDSKNKQKIIEAINNVSNKMATKDYQDNIEAYACDVEGIRCKTANYISNPDNLPITQLNAKIKKIAVDKCIKLISLKMKKDVNYAVNENFGLDEKEFVLSNYSQEMIEQFLWFYMVEVKQNENPLIKRDMRKNEKAPNIKIGSYAKYGKIKDNYEGYYDFIMNYRNSLCEKEKVYTMPKCKELLASILTKTTDKINNMPMHQMSTQVISKEISKIKDEVNEIILNNKPFSYYYFYGMSEIYFEMILTFFERICEYYYVDDKLIECINVSLIQILKSFIKSTDDSNYYNRFEISKSNDIFQDYAFLFYLNNREEENVFIESLLKSLSVELPDLKKRDQSYIEELSDYCDEKDITKQYILTARYNKQEKERIIGKLKDILEAWEVLLKYCDYNIDLYAPQTYRGSYEEIYLDKKFILDFKQKKQEYNMINILHNINNGNYVKNNCRDEEVIVFYEKIKRGIDCAFFGSGYYLKFNEIKRTLYKIKGVVYKRQRENRINILESYLIYKEVMDIMFEVIK